MSAAGAGGGMKHAATEPAHLDNRRERRGRSAAGRAVALRRAPSDSDCSGETASLSADSADRGRPPVPLRQTKARRRRGSEWEVLEGLKDGQRFERRPEVFNGYLHKKRKWPLKGWHKRFFVVDGGILVYARSPTDVARGRLHGSVDVGLSVISAKARRRRIDIDADEFIYHLRAKTPDVFRTWLNVLKAHRLYRQHLLTFGARESVPKIHAPLDDLPATDASLSMLSSFVSDSSRTDSINDELNVIKPPSLNSPPESYPFPLLEDTVDVNKNLVQYKDDHVTYQNPVKDWDVTQNNYNVNYKDWKVTSKADNDTYKSFLEDSFLINKENHATYKVADKEFNKTYKNKDKDDIMTNQNQIKYWNISHKNDGVTNKNKNKVNGWEVTLNNDNITHKDWDEPLKNDNVTNKTQIKVWEKPSKDDNGTYKSLVEDSFVMNKENHATYTIPDKDFNAPYKFKDKDDNVTNKNQIKDWDITHKNDCITCNNTLKDWNETHKHDPNTITDCDKTHKNNHVAYNNLVKNWDARHKLKNTYRNPDKDWNVAHKENNVTFVSNWNPALKDSRITSKYKDPVKIWDVAHKGDNIISKNPVRDWHIDPVKEDLELLPDFDLPLGLEGLDDSKVESTERIWNHSLCSMKCLQALYKQEIPKFQNKRKFVKLSNITEKGQTELSMILDVEPPLSIFGLESNLLRNDEISDITIPPVVPTFSEIPTLNKNKGIERKVMHVPPLFKDVAKNTFFLFSHKNKTRSQILKKSKKSTNIRKYKNVLSEPTLEKPFRRVLIQRNEVNASHSNSGKDSLNVNKTEKEVQVNDVSLKETKSQYTMPSTELDPTTENLAKSFLQMYLLSSQRFRFEQSVTQMIRDLCENNSNISVSPIELVLKDLLDYWVSNIHPNNVQCSLKENDNNAFKNKRNGFQSLETQFESKTTKDATVSTIYNLIALKSEAIQTPSKWKGLIDEESKSSFVKERRIEEIEKLVKNTMYETDYDGNSNTKSKDNKITKELLKNIDSVVCIKNASKFSAIENTQESDKENTAAEPKNKEKEMKSFIAEAPIPPTIVKAYLQMLKNGIRDSNNISEESKDKHDFQNNMPNVKRETLQKKGSLAMLNDGMDKTKATENKGDETSQTVIKELFSRIANYFNSSESINKYTKHFQPNDIKVEGSVEGSHITLHGKDRDDNSLVLDLTKYSLDNISVLSDARGEICITIKLREPLTNGRLINQNKLSIRFSENKPKPKNHIIEPNSGDSRSSSASFRRISRISFRNPLFDLEPLPIVEKIPWMTVSDGSIATYKAYRKTCKTRKLNKITRENKVKEFSNARDDPKTCYILSELRKRGYRLLNRKYVTKEHKGISLKPSQITMEINNPDSKIIANRSKSGLNQAHDEFEVINLQPKELTLKLSKCGLKQENTPNNINTKSKTIIDENFILSLLENLTLLSKHVPSFHKDIKGLFLKLKKRLDKKRNQESTLGLLGEIYNNDQVAKAVKTYVNATISSLELPKVKQIHNSVGEKLKQAQVNQKEVVSEATNFKELINNETQTELLATVNRSSKQKYNESTQCLKTIATSISITDFNHSLNSKTVNVKVNQLENVAVERTNERTENNDSKLKNDEEFDLTGVLRNLFNMSTSDVNFNFVFDENKKCYKSVPTRLNKTKRVAKKNVQISNKEERVAHNKTRHEKDKSNIPNEIIIEHQKISTSKKNYEALLLSSSMKQDDKNLKPMLDETEIVETEVINFDKDVNVCFNITEKKSRGVPCLSFHDNGLISPTAPLRAQAGFVAGTPGGRLANWIVESGGPLENASRELGQAQLSIQQLQRLLDSMELQHHHHDTDQVSLEGASPNVKKDRRKFGLRKKKSNSKCASVELAPPIDPSNSHMALSTLTAPPSPGGASSAPNSAASLPIAIAATRPVSLPGAESLGSGAAPLGPLTPDHQLREDFTVLAKDLVGTLNTVLATLVCERGRLRSAMEATESGTPGNAVVAALRTNLTTALQQNSELRSRLSRIHDASDLAEVSSVNNADPAVRPFKQSLSFSSSCVSASEFFDAEEHGTPPDILPADETGVIELDGDSSSEAGSLSSGEEGSASSDNSDGALLSAEPVSLTVSSNGVSLEPASGWSRRTTLPCPRPTPGGPSLWNLLYKNIGKDLSQVSMPVTINEPLNMLQRLCEELEYSELLDAAADCPNALERMSLIAAFAVSAYAASAHRAASKPFNPLLAETYECVRGDKGFKFLAEQVSHHPPISACHAESSRWVLWQEARIKTKFWGKSMEFQPAGRVHVRLISTGDHYCWNKVTTCVHNLFGGQRWVDQYGDMLITNYGNDITAKLNFIKASSWSSSRHEVRGWVTDGMGGRLRLQGRWSEALYAGEPPAARCLWRPGAMPPEHELYYGFTRFAMELNEMEPGLRELLPHTDTRLRPDQRALEEGDVEAAERFKLQLEQAQRDRRSQQDLHQPAWFRKAYEDGTEMWVFTGEYWPARDSGFPHLRAPAIW